MRGISAVRVTWRFKMQIATIDKNKRTARERGRAFISRKRKKFPDTVRVWIRRAPRDKWRPRRASIWSVSALRGTREEERDARSPVCDARRPKLGIVAVFVDRCNRGRSAEVDVTFVSFADDHKFNIVSSSDSKRTSGRRG